MKTCSECNENPREPRSRLCLECRREYQRNYYHTTRKDYVPVTKETMQVEHGVWGGHYRWLDFREKEEKIQKDIAILKKNGYNEKVDSGKADEILCSI